MKYFNLSGALPTLNLAQRILKAFNVGYVRQRETPAPAKVRSVSYGEGLRAHFARQALARHEAEQARKHAIRINRTSI
jgi:hypothetical protein